MRGAELLEKTGFGFWDEQAGYLCVVKTRFCIMELKLTVHATGLGSIY